jgi:hypothetical protein
MSPVNLITAGLRTAVSAWTVRRSSGNTATITTRFQLDDRVGPALVAGPDSAT